MRLDILIPVSIFISSRAYFGHFCIKKDDISIIVIAWLASPKRLERSTHSLEGCCSIQLSYGDIFLRCVNNINTSKLNFKDFYVIFQIIFPLHLLEAIDITH